jgi:hypothetical protein
MTDGRRRALAAAMPLVAAVVFAHGVCGMLFRCGCVAFSMAQCSIHHEHAGGMPPCPWCTGRVLFPLALLMWTSGAAAAGWITRGRGHGVTLAVSLAGVILAIVVSGAFTIAATGYPTLLGFHLRS